MVSEYNLQLIRQAKQELQFDPKSNTWTLEGRFLKGIEPDYVLNFSTWSNALHCIINNLTKE